MAEYTNVTGSFDRGAAVISWPNDKCFAFTITDDTDGSVLDRIRPVYDLLLEHGILATKTVWPLSPRGSAVAGGDSLENASYAEWVRQLADAGVEIALHGAADESSPRERTLRAFERFREELGTFPSLHINHVGQADALYWHDDRFDRPQRWLYSVYRRSKGEGLSFGHVPSSPFFWGDICRDHIRYVRNFVWNDINTLSADPLMPYHDPTRSYVRYWFSGTRASDVRSFCRVISEANQDRLAGERGACILYAHLGITFYPFTAEFVRLIKRLSTLGGWFVPASTMLDWIGQQRGFADTSLRRREYSAMQWRWMAEQVRRQPGVWSAARAATATTPTAVHALPSN
jgi:hypothetical protein